jgi:hypothetical protein
MTKNRRDLLFGLGLLAVAVLAGGYAMVQGPGSAGQQTDFASTRAESEPSPQPLVPFNGAQAMDYLRQICDLGPRVSGTTAHAKMVDLLEKHFTEQGFEVNRQKFDYQQVSQKGKTTFVNLMARWNPSKQERLLICTHYDTRPIAHEEPRVNWNKPMLGANDSGSGPAWMMEMARHMKQLAPDLGVDFVCFDGEEFVFTLRDEVANPDIYFIGSFHFAQDYARRRKDGQAPAYREGILLDMIAGKNPQFFMEGYSVARAQPLVERIWQIARDQRCRAFVPQRGKQVEDDHLQLLNVGVPCIDIIPVHSERLPDGPGRFLSYPHWHRITDTVANCAPEGMEQVAKVLAVWMKTAK